MRISPHWSDVKQYLDYLSKMLLIRYFEEKVDWMFSRDMLSGTAHLCIGQEATAVGAISAIGAEDIVISTHRGHGHILAKGADPEMVLCEIVGKEPGYCKGIGGTQHMCAAEINFMGTNGITGGGIPIATGIGLALKLKREKGVVLCFFGDGASNQGTFHESLNMASLWKVPVIYFCENNFYAMSTPFHESMSINDIAIRAASYGMPSAIVDGMDVLKVREVTAKAVEQARNGGGPILIEAKTYRYHGHSKSDPCRYRSKEEEGLWKKRDPIQYFENLLIQKGIDPHEIETLKRKARDRIEKAYRFSLEAAYHENDNI